MSYDPNVDELLQVIFFINDVRYDIETPIHY